MSDALVQDTLVRMVVPIRREFGAALDVARMRRDAPYAHSIVSHALRSSDARLRGYAKLIDKHLLHIGEMPPEPSIEADSQAGAASLRSKAGAAARALVDSVGPIGEEFAIRIERAEDASTLAATLQKADAFIAQLRGPAAARAWRQSLGAAEAAV